MNVQTTLEECVDSKVMWDSLTTRHKPTDKSVKADVNAIGHEFETKAVRTMTWVPNKLSPVYVLAKKDSHLINPLQLLSAVILIDLSKSKDCTSAVSTG